MDQKCIPVIKKGDSSVHWLRLEDICYVSLEDRFIVYYTKDDAYYHLNKLEDILYVFMPEGFEKLDRSIVANMANLTHYDSQYGKVFFDEEVTPQSTYAPVSPIYLGKVKKLLGKVKDVAVSPFKRSEY
jgi:DNA-binding LytR/AlgR family response regulator